MFNEYIYILQLKDGVVWYKSTMFNFIVYSLVINKCYNHITIYLSAGPKFGVLSHEVVVFIIVCLLKSLHFEYKYDYK